MWLYFGAFRPYVDRPLVTAGRFSNNQKINLTISQIGMFCQLNGTEAMFILFVIYIIYVEYFPRIFTYRYKSPKGKNGF